ncbi:MAG: zinc ABC transporter substrate-binding protein [Melioribacteraceae bacterium]|nr:zinc ABC transporter substrate-binding protein [Melioribacteraceae bacterium]
MKKIVLSIFIVIGLFSCTQNNTSSNKIYVSVQPQKFFLEKIVGNEFEIDVMVKPGMSPATYEPLPTQMLELSKSKIFFSIGVPFEKNWLPVIKENNKSLIVCKTDEGISKRKMDSVVELFDEDEHEIHNHKHSHGEPDPHIWLNPVLVKQQAENMFQSLIKIYPAKESLFRANLTNFQNELDSLDQDLSNILAGVENKSFLVFHPSWGYFADRYKLKQIAIEVEGKEPSPKELSNIIDKVKELGIKKIFVQKQFSAKAAEAVAKELNSDVVQIDPLSYEYINTLKKIAQAIAK